MLKKTKLNYFVFNTLFVIISSIIAGLKFYPIYLAKENIIINFAVHPFDICAEYPDVWLKIKIIYIVFFISSSFIISNTIYSSIFNIKNNSNNKVISNNYSDLHLKIFDSNFKDPIILPKQGLYQNILITGTIGSGKTSCAMYPFTKQLIKYKYNDSSKKLGMLILDVKGNYYSQVKKYAKYYKREDDLIVIGLDENIKYNPLDKPNLKPTILANRLKTILTLFSKNNSESYWLDKAEQILAECIKLCRLYNNGYVTFSEIHKLVTVPNYYSEKLHDLRNKFLSGKLSKQEVYDLLSAIEFFEKEFINLDSRTASILKSEITRITGCFISDFDVLNTFSPEKVDLNFFGFEDVVNSGKIVVLKMNIAEYRNLSKIIAAYLKLDFQTEVMARLAHANSEIRDVAFISDEYHEYVTETDADFFAQSREAKCINIVATQSYTSLLNAINNQYSVKVIVQNLINKFWFRTDDIFTIEDIQKQVGKEDKKKISKSFSESRNKAKFNFITKNFNSNDTSVSESINSFTQYDFVYDTQFFTQKLPTFSCLAFLSTGTSILTPKKLTLTPYFILDKDMENKI